MSDEKFSILRLKKEIVDCGLHSAVVVCSSSELKVPGSIPSGGVPLSKVFHIWSSSQHWLSPRNGVSVLYTGHVKETESLFEKELGTTMPGLICIQLLSSLYVLPRTVMDSIRNEVSRMINISYVKNLFHHRPKINQYI